MEYQEIIKVIENKRRFGSLPGIKISEKLLAAVGNPQNDLAFVHIAGTNGKGSTAAFLCSILKEAGILAGAFTSPHLIEFRERISVGGVMIPEEAAARLGQRLLDLPLDASPSMFDYCLAMALLYFQEADCRLVVLETGLGGRLDATNIIDAPLVGVITKIGYDHMETLGDTLAEIAAEKAGILKKGMRAVLGSQKPEAMEVLVSACEKLGVLYQAVDASRILPTDGGFSYPGESPYQIGLPGDFQRENAMAAILCARELAGLGYDICEEDLHRGIAKAVWNGRMEIISKEPFLMIDGAHNEDGVRALVQSLAHMFPDEKFHFIMGVMADKDYKKMAECILPLAQKVTAMTPENQRSLQGEDLAGHFLRLGIKAERKADFGEVFASFLMKKNRKEQKEKTIVFGSLYFIGEIRKFFQNTNII